MQKLLSKTAMQCLLTATVSLIIFSACQRDLEDPGTGNNNGGTPTNIDNITVIASMRGVVVDENNQPVTGATVKSGTNTTTTDRYGVFRFNDISLAKENGKVLVERNGYFTAHRTFPTTAGRIHNVRIKLLPKTNTGNFTASSGGTITLTTGGKLVMPANAVTDAAGNAYSGQVNVAMTWINPTATDLPDIMMGDLRGLTTAGDERGLETFGMLGVELTTPGGQPLQVASGKTAELSFPIPASLAGAAPATIDLWHFDEATARWKQEGTATKTGNFYVANVSHFSFWNCDAPFPLINLCMKLVDATTTQPLNNVQVRIKRSNGSYGSGWTDSLGNLCGKVPKNEPLTLEVMNQCNTAAYSQSIGPFSADANLGTVSATLPAASTLVITGTLLNCANTNVTNGAVVIYTPGSYSYVIPVTNGTFSHTILRCTNTAINFSVLGVDYTALQQGMPISGTGNTGTVNIGNIVACGNNSAQFAEYIIDGNPYTFAAPPDQFNCADSTGTWGSYTNKTQFYGFKGNGNTAIGSFNLMFTNNIAAGSFPIQSGFMQYTASVQALQFVGPSPTVNITSFGAAGGGFIEGNFNEMMMVSGTPKMVSCTFRVRRN